MHIRLVRVFLLSLVYMSIISAFNYRRRCLLYNHKCVSSCPRNMHPYHTRCDRSTASQRTCDTPRVELIGFTCGWSRCDCNGDLVLEEETAACVNILACKKGLKNKIKKKHSGHRRSGHRRVRIQQEDELADLLK